MKTIIAGGRDYNLTPEDYALLDKLLIELPITEVVSGCARGADACGETWAVTRKIPVKPFPADWDKHSRAAGPVRNSEMAEYAEACVLFPGGRGTGDMLKKATAKGLKIIDLRVRRIG